MSDARQPGYEFRDAPAWVAASAIGGVLLLLLVTAGSVALLLQTFPGADAAVAVAPLPRASQSPPAPRLETSPQRRRLELERRQTRILESYGWTNRRAGLARVPIRAAMTLQAQRGWPDPEAGRR